MKLLPAFLTVAVALCSAPLLNAQTNSVATEPVGFVTTTIAASTGSGWKSTYISPVLLQYSGTTGATSGAITGVTSNTVTIGSAGWTAGQLRSSDGHVLFKTGPLAGLIVPILSNTETTATVDVMGADLVSLGAAVGNTIQLVQGDTLLSMFGTPQTDGSGVIGGTAAAYTAGQTDRVTVRDSSGISRVFYFNTDSNTWRRASSGSDQGGVRISPLAGALYQRIGTKPFSQTSTGNVPTVAVKYLVPTSGTIYLARFYPTGGTLNSFGFQNLPGWTSTDRVTTVDSSGIARNYTWNGSQWRRSGSGSDQGTISIPIGGAVAVNRNGSGPAQLLSVNLNYGL